MHKRKVLNWYKKNGRHTLPWRLSNDPYEVYISELMLQQTQVKTVLERFYFPFLKRFPSLESIQKSTQEEVLHHWQGLGYYQRAKNLHKSAQLCGGVLPDTYEALIALPGIGKNTAHAILSLGYRKPYAIMEANVKRIFHRLEAKKELKANVLWQKAEEMLSKEYPFEYNQAMMDIGSLVCIKKAPKCYTCPFESICKGKEDPHLYPEKKRTKKRIKKENIVVFVYENSVYMTKREERFLEGLWQFYPTEKKEFSFLNEKVKLSKKHQIGELEVTYSHFTHEVEVYVYPIGGKNEQFISLDRIKEYSLSRLEKQILLKWEESQKEKK